MMSESPASVMERTPTLFGCMRENKHGSETIYDIKLTNGIRADVMDLPEVLSAGGTELDVGAGVVVNTSLGQHGVVLNLRLAKRRAVTRDDDQLGC